jgi:hypothetical protein
VKAACPNCGAEVDFRYDDSFVRVCGHCRAAVVRGDRGIETLGRVADLAPTHSPLHLFVEGRFRGLGFMLVGRAQIQHGAGGTWQEWYDKFDDGRWGWVAEAQGRVFLTFEAVGAGPTPPFQSLVPGHQIGLFDGEWRTFTLAERGVATYLAAEGELPYRFVPGGAFQFADLADGAGRFATLDYGGLTEGRAQPTTYLGHEVTYAELQLSGAPAALPVATPTIKARHLACPNCGGSIELRAPDATQRVACPYCAAFLDATQGDLRLLRLLGAKQRGQPAIPLGSRGQFEDQELTVIGFVERQAVIDGQRWPFSEYLLHAPALGFRWLVESDGHWSYVKPVGAGAVTETPHGHAQYGGVVFRRFQTSPVIVSAVLGEFYWRLEVGDEVEATDFVAPPAMLSKEVTADEVTWSLGEYLTPRDVKKRLGLKELPRAPIGVGPSQPYRHHRAPAYFGTLVLAILAVAAGLGIMSENRTVRQETFSVLDPGTLAADATLSGSSPAASQVFFTQSFDLERGKNVEVQLQAFIDNSWVYVAGDLVNEDTGELRAFEKAIEYYRGYEGGESWSEGSTTEAVFIAAVPAGRYVLRLDVQRDPAPAAGGAVSLSVTVKQDVFRVSHALTALLVVGIPGLLFLLLQWRFERRRWRDSNHAAWHLRPGDDDE